MHYDIIIVGGGLVGRSLACALRHSALRIALIDATPAERPDPRLIALNYGSFSFLNKIGIWPSIERYSAPILEVQVSQRGRFGSTRMTAEQIQLPALGQVVPAQEINRALGDILAPLPTSQFTELRPATVKAITLGEKSSTLTLDSGNSSSELHAELIIAADGTHSTLRQLLDLETETVDYQQSALVTTATLGRSHAHIAYERFLDDGALAMLPLYSDRGSQCASIWTASHTHIARLAALSDEDFLAELQTQFGYRLGRLKNIGKRHVFPLHFMRVKKPLRGNVLLIGNAAHTIHPVAAQGLNLALYEIAQLSKQLLNAQEKGQPLAAALAEPLLRSPQKTNLLLSHYLTPLFSSRVPGLGLARQLGMIGLDLCGPLKNKFSRLLAMEEVKWM